MGAYFDIYFANKIQVMNENKQAKTLALRWWTILLITCSLAYGANAVSSVPSSTHTHQVNTSAIAFIQEADLLKNTEPQRSMDLAKKGLSAALDNNDHNSIGQAYAILGGLAKSALNPVDAKHYYLNAYRAFAKTSNNTQLIVNGVEYAELLIADKEYNKAQALLDDIISVTVAIEDNHLVASSMILKANTFYDLKRYDEANTEFLASLEFLTQNNTQVITMRSGVYHQLAQVHKQLKDYDAALIYHKQALALRKSLNNAKLTAMSLRNLAIIESKRLSLHASLDYAFQSINLYTTLAKSEAQLAELYVLIGSSYRQLERYETSLEYLDKALKNYEALNDNGKIAESLNQMGLLYVRLDQREEALALYYKAIDLPHSQVAPKTLAASYREIASIKARNGHYELALKMAGTAHNIFLANKELLKATKTARIIGEIYHKQGKYEQASSMYTEALALAETTNSKVDEAKILLRLGQTLQQTDINEALKVFEASLEIAEKYNYNSTKASALKGILSIHKSKQDYEQALAASEALLKVSDDIHDAQEANKVAYAKATLDSHIMETEIDTLREKVELDQLTLAKKNNEIEIAQQANLISELELTQSQYAKYLLITLLIICVCVVFYINRVIIASRKRNAELNYIAKHDPLTDCYNRRGLFKNTDKHFQNITKTSVYSFIVADIDHFKRVNDMHGHDAGDEVLVEVVKRFKQCIDNTGIVARLGGEEFCIALNNVPVEQAKSMAEDLRAIIDADNIFGIAVTCSFGVSTFESLSDTPTKLITKADRALYESKSNGRNRVTVWDNSLAPKQED